MGAWITQKDPAAAASDGIPIVDPGNAFLELLYSKPEILDPPVARSYNPEIPYVTRDGNLMICLPDFERGKY